MIGVNPEIVNFLISRAHQFHAQEGVVIPETPGSPSDDWALQVLADHSDNAGFAEVKSAVNDLEPRQQQTIVALMWLGRGDYSVEEWDAALEEAQRNWTPETATYLMAHPMLADFLQEGLSLLGYEFGE